MRKMLPIAGPLIAILSAILIIRIVETGSASNDNHLELRLLTVATEATDGFNRFNRSAHVYGVRVEVLGMGSEWRGGDVSRYPGGAHKLILLRRALQQYKNEEKMVILFTDSYDVILTGGEKEILPLFQKSNASILFSAEEYCWPDSSLTPSYPRVEYPGKRFLNSGGFIGYAPHVYDMITSQPLDHEDDDDQLFLTKIFLNPDNRSKWNMKLDSRSQVFQTLNGIPAGEVEIQFDDLTGDAFMVNTMTKTRPLVIHGNGASKMHLNSLSNYLPRSWNSQTGCLSCLEDQTESLMKMSADEGDVEANNKKEEIVQEEGIESVGVEREAATPGGRLVIGIFIQRPTPFLPQFFHHVHALNYPKDWIDLVIYSPIHYHDQHVQHFLGHNVTGEYHSVRVIGRHGHKVLKNKGEEERKAIEPSGAGDVAAAAVRQGLSKEGKDASGSSPHLESLTGSSSDQVVTEAEARTMGLEECLSQGCDYYLSLDSEARITNPDTLTHLIHQNKNVIAPLLTRPGKLWSNFWGSLSHDGFYARSFDYVDIVKNNRRGTWNVPHVSQVYLIKGEVIRKGLTGTTSKETTRREQEEEATNQIRDGAPASTDAATTASPGYPSFVSPRDPGLDADMSFSESLREQGIFIYVTNLHDYGHLVNPDHYDTSFRNSDLRQIFHNQLDWERRYIHPNYSQLLDPSFQIPQPCPDVYWFPVVTPDFCDELVQEMEHFGKWSTGTNQDERLVTGYENVPTRDIHMNQVGMEQEWLFFLREYIRPVQEKLFVGYHHDPPKAIMNFVVRYRPDEQPSLRPHHDSSTYTINIALNTPHLDYEGGGCRFHRYNCTVSNMRKGWSLMHPGRLTHLHEGLRVTKGTRYIMVSFVDP